MKIATDPHRQTQTLECRVGCAHIFIIRCGSKALSCVGSFINRDIFGLRRPNIDLSRTVKFPFGVFGALFPLSNPAGEPSDGEHNGEHVSRDPHGSENDSAVKVDIWVEVVVNEIRVF